MEKQLIFLMMNLIAFRRKISLLTLTTHLAISLKEILNSIPTTASISFYLMAPIIIVMIFQEISSRRALLKENLSSLTIAAINCPLFQKMDKLLSHTNGMPMEGGNLL